jgi:hypothetical protein
MSGFIPHPMTHALHVGKLARLVRPKARKIQEGLAGDDQPVEIM